MSEQITDPVDHRLIALRTVKHAYDQMTHILQVERVEFERYVKETGDYPNPLWNQSGRREVERLRELAETTIEQAISTVHRDGYIIMQPLVPWEYHKAKQQFLEDVSKVKTDAPPSSS